MAEKERERRETGMVCSEDEKWMEIRKRKGKRSED